MLLKKENEPKQDYLADWPTHYHEIEDAMEKKEVLDKAIALQLDSKHDSYRQKLLNRRFFTKDKKGKTDAFMHAWMMIKASSVSGVSFLTKKKLQRELLSYMEELCILNYEPECKEDEEMLVEEWNAFAKLFISSCTGNRYYCSTLFGFVRITDHVVATKIAEEIKMVTDTYPSLLGMGDEFRRFRQILIYNFCQMIEGGDTYFNA